MFRQTTFDVSTRRKRESSNSRNRRAGGSQAACEYANVAKRPSGFIAFTVASRNRS